MRALPALFVAALAWAVAASAEAGALRVSPVGFNLDAARPAASLSLQNQAAEPLTVQVRVFLWRQDGGKETLEPTKDLVASPPFATLAAGAEQTVRLVRVGAIPASGETAYRILIDELPSAAANDGHSVTLLMRHSLPVFVAGASQQPPAVTWSLSTSTDGLAVTARNAGGKRLRLANVLLYDASGAQLAGQGGLLGYVLGGAEQTWTLARAQGAPPAAPTRLRAETDQGAVDVVLDGVHP